MNSLFVNKNISITQLELDELIFLPSVNFYLPITGQTYPALSGLMVKPHTRYSK